MSFKDISPEAFAATEFNKIFSGRQLHQGRGDIFEVLKNENYYMFIDYKVLHIKIMRNL
jgi:hypothetical protein